jgi:hypothetical protein
MDTDSLIGYSIGTVEAVTANDSAIGYSIGTLDALTTYDSAIGYVTGVISGGTIATGDSDVGFAIGSILTPGSSVSLVGYAIATVASSVPPFRMWSPDDNTYFNCDLFVWDGASYAEVTVPTSFKTARPIGIYNGTRSDSVPDPDMATSAAFNYIPPISSSYYIGNQVPNLSSESTRLARGTHAVIDCGMKFPTSYAGTPVTMADLADQTPATGSMSGWTGSGSSRR